MSDDDSHYSYRSDDDDAQSDEEVSYHSDDSSDMGDEDCSPPPLMREVSSGTHAMLLDPSAEIAYKTCDYTEFFPKAQYLIARVADLLCVNPDTAQVLLCHYRWDEEKLTEAYFVDPARVLAACGYPPSATTTAPVGTGSGTGTVTATTLGAVTTAGATAGATIDAVSLPPVALMRCPVCFDECLPAESYALCCGHVFCRECFTGHVTCQIREGPACIHMTCPAFQCTAPVALSTVLALCNSSSSSEQEIGGTLDESGEEVQQLYLKFLTHHFISMNSRMRFCPGNGCEQIAYGRCIQNNVQCSHPSCGQHFCFKCGQEAHDPCSCEQLRLWHTKCQEDNDTFVYLESRTRPCPSCRMAMEPDAINCGYMRCKACAAFFCWHCMQVCCVVLCCVGRCCTVLYCIAVLCCAVLCCEVMCCAMSINMFLQVTDDHRHREGKACNKYVADNTGQDESEIARKR